MANVYAGRFYDAFFDNNSKLMKSTTFVVYDDQDATSIATTYTDRTKTTVAPQVNSTDAEGMAEFFAVPGPYWVKVGTSSPRKVEVKEDVDDTADVGQVNAAISAHAQSTVGVHGIADTAVLETQAGAQARADTALSTARAYADLQIQIQFGLTSAKTPVRIAVTDAINVSNPGGSNFDGVTLASGDAVLRAVGTDAANGIYIFNGPSSPMTRRSDADTSGEMTSGILVPVAEGTNSSSPIWQLTTDAPITLGTTPLTFSPAAGDTSGFATQTDLTAVENALDALTVTVGGIHFPTGVLATVNGIEADANGNVELGLADLGLELTAVDVYTDLGGVKYPSVDGLAGQAVLRGSTPGSTVFGTPSSGPATLMADSDADGVGLWGKRRLPARKYPQYSRILADFSATGHGWVGSGPTGFSVTDDTSVKLYGTSSLNIAPPLNDVTMTYATSPTGVGFVGGNVNLLTNRLAVLSLQPLTGLGHTNPKLEVSSDNGTTWSAMLDTARTHDSFGQWWEWRLSKDSFPATSGVDFTAINRIRIGARTATTGTGPVPWYIQRVAEYPATETKAQLAWLIQGSASMYPFLGEFYKRNLRPTIVVRPGNITNNLNSPLTLDQCKQLHMNYGFGMIPSQWTDAEINPSNYYITNATEYESGLRKSIHWFWKNGFEQPLMQFWNFAGAGSGAGQAMFFCRKYFPAGIARNQPDDFTVNVLPTHEPCGLMSQQLFGTGTSLTNRYTTYLNRLAESGGVGFLYSQGLQQATGNSTITAASDVSAICDLIQSLSSSIDFVPVNTMVEARL